MLAIVETCGKQYEIQEGRYIDVEFLGKEEQETLELDKVVMIVAGEQSQVGQPYVEGALVKATVLKNGKEQKVLVYKQRCKKGYRRKNGHRQLYSRIMIDSIEFPGKDAISQVEEKPAKETKTKKAKAEKTEATAAKSTKSAAAKTTAAKSTAKKAKAEKAETPVVEETKTEE
jgi:large subunit ribosomal protein L21